MIRVLFEDEHFVNLLPLVYFRPVWELRCGITTLAEKLKGDPQAEWRQLPRTYLDRDGRDHAWLKALPENLELLLVNGRWLADAETARAIEALSTAADYRVLTNGKTLLALRCSAAEVRGHLDKGVLNSRSLLKKFPARTIDATVINYIWEAVSRNGEQIVRDWESLGRPAEKSGKIYDGVHLVEPQKIHIAAGAVLKPGVVVDAEAGPVWIDRDVTVMANAVLEGPLYIGPGSTIKIAAKIYENTTIGPVCKVGGEVEGCIIHGYSNKQHDGFLGHAYLGEWVNLGADTNNSDLKNNYGNVTVQLNGHSIDTRERFVGLMMGDHSKTGINCMLNTGTIVGVSCNIYGAGLPPKFVPSFSWGSAEGLSRYNFEKAKALAATVMGRRKVDFDAYQEQLFEGARELAREVEQGTLLGG